MDSKSDWHALVEQKGVIHTFKVNKKGAVELYVFRPPLPRT